MISIKVINQNNFKICFELDSKTMSLWSLEQWKSELLKDGVKVLGLYFFNELIGICSYQVIFEEAQINYFSVSPKYHRKGLGTYLMSYLTKECSALNIRRLTLEVSKNNLPAEKFYNYLGFCTFSIRKNYYKDGTDAVLKEKKLY